MLATVNLYCSDCLRTQRFIDLERHLICEVCTKRLVRVEPSVQETMSSFVVAISDGSDRQRRRAG